jgi:hypothetical protein
VIFLTCYFFALRRSNSCERRRWITNTCQLSVTAYSNLTSISGGRLVYLQTEDPVCKYMFSRELKGKASLGSRRRIWEDNIKTDVK